MDTICVTTVVDEAYQEFIPWFVYFRHQTSKRSLYLMTAVYVKQYGAKRSGTNYTRWLLQENFVDVQVLSEILGWKHGPHANTIDWGGADWTDKSHPAAETERKKLLALVTDDIRKAVASGELRYAITVKNPYAWWDSYVRFTEAGRPELAMAPEEGVDLWNLLHSNWHALSLSKNRLAVMVRYEDILFDLDATLDRVAMRLKLQKSGGDYRHAKVRMNRHSDLSWDIGPTTNPFDPSHYINKEYLARFDGTLLDIFRKRLNGPLLEALGYEVL